MDLELFIGIPAGISKADEEKLIDILNERHPDAVLSEVVEGYWSGVEERTIVIKVESELKFAQDTAEIIKHLLVSGFVAIEVQD